MYLYFEKSAWLLLVHICVFFPGTKNRVMQGLAVLGKFHKTGGNR